ncbi:MAG TPA: ROK family protein [Dongiaceae bacterium]|jgi:glucokinase
MKSDATHAIGIDVGGTKIAGGLIELRSGAIVARRHQPTLPQRGGQAVLDDVLSQAGELAAEARTRGLTASAIGVGLPQLVTPAGDVRSDHLFDWRELRAAERLGGVAPARLESDVRAAALAEARFGAGRGHEIFCYVTIGTGLSYCLVIGGRPFAGARGYAIHFASAPQWVRCRACGTVHKATLEELDAGPGIAAAYGARRQRPVAGAEDVFAAAVSGDADAVAVLDAAALELGAVIGQMVNMLDPQALVIGGGLGLARGRYGDRLIAAIRDHVFAGDASGLPILSAALGAEAGIVGAALSAVDPG